MARYLTGRKPALTLRASETACPSTHRRERVLTTLPALSSSLRTSPHRAPTPLDLPTSAV
jgi:hypothetical protein